MPERCTDDRRAAVERTRVPRGSIGRPSIGPPIAVRRWLWRSRHPRRPSRSLESVAACPTCGSIAPGATPYGGPYGAARRGVHGTRRRRGRHPLTKPDSEGRPCGTERSLVRSQHYGKGKTTQAARPPLQGEPRPQAQRWSRLSRRLGPFAVPAPSTPMWYHAWAADSTLPVAVVGCSAPEETDSDAELLPRIGDRRSIGGGDEVDRVVDAVDEHVR